MLLRSTRKLYLIVGFMFVFQEVRRLRPLNGGVVQLRLEMAREELMRKTQGLEQAGAERERTPLYR